MASAGINCCSMSSSTNSPDLSGNVYKEFKCFDKPAFVIVLVQAKPLAKAKFLSNKNTEK